MEAWEKNAIPLFKTKASDAAIADAVQAPGLTRDAQRKRVQRLRASSELGPQPTKAPPPAKSRWADMVDNLRTAGFKGLGKYAQYERQADDEPQATADPQPTARERRNHQRGYERWEFGLDDDGPKQYVIERIPFQKPRYVEVRRNPYGHTPKEPWSFFHS